MKRNLICAALLAGMAMANSAMAQDYDDRWYLTAGAGWGWFDGDRNVNSELYGTLGVGKFISPNWSLDLEMYHTNPELDYDFGEERNWELMSLSLVGRYHFGEADRWRPYIAAGLGVQEHHDGTQRQPLALGYNESRTGSNLLGILGVGMQGGLGRGYLRAEIGARFDADDGENDDFDDDLDDIFDEDNDNTDSFLDGYVGLSFVLPLGERAVAPVAVVAPQKTCADLDDDSDGVNNCDDRCPGSTAGQAIGPDGCPVPVAEPEPAPEPKPFRG